MAPRGCHEGVGCAQPPASARQAEEIASRARVWSERQFGTGMTAFIYEPASKRTSLTPPESSRNCVIWATISQFWCWNGVRRRLGIGVGYGRAPTDSIVVLALVIRTAPRWGSLNVFRRQSCPPHVVAEGLTDTCPDAEAATAVAARMSRARGPTYFTFLAAQDRTLGSRVGLACPRALAPVTDYP